MHSQKRAEVIESLGKEVRRFIAGSILFNLKVAQDLGANAIDLQCLNLLELQQNVRPGDLAKWTRLSTGGVTVLLDRLEAAGYIQREPNPKDRRSSIIRLVPGSLRRLHSIYRSKGEGLMSVLSEYNDHDLHVIQDFFQKTNGAGEG
jgi:DNA-binding MarR family transcriptional regulator